MPSVFFFFFYRTCAAILHQLCTFVCNFFLAHVQMLQLSLLSNINYIIDNDDISPLHRPDYRTQKRLFMRLCFKNLWSEFSGKQIAPCIQTYGIINAIVWTSNDRENRCVLLIFRERLFKPQLGNFLPAFRIYPQVWWHGSCERSAV